MYSFNMARRSSLSRLTIALHNLGVVLLKGESSFTVVAKPAAGGKGKGKDSRSTQATQYVLTLKTDSILEQALQVQYMLPGGMYGRNSKVPDRYNP